MVHVESDEEPGKAFCGILLDEIIDDPDDLVPIDCVVCAYLDWYYY